MAALPRRAGIDRWSVVKGRLGVRWQRQSAQLEVPNGTHPAAAAYSVPPKVHSGGTGPSQLHPQRPAAGAAGQLRTWSWRPYCRCSTQRPRSRSVCPTAICGRGHSDADGGGRVNDMRMLLNHGGPVFGSGEPAKQPHINFVAIGNRSTDLRQGAHDHNGGLILQLGLRQPPPLAAACRRRRRR